MTSAAFQPSFADLGQPLADVTFCVVDLETTGASADDAITEIGAVKVHGGEVIGEFQTLVNPHVHIPPLIAVLTGITNAMVAGAPTLSGVLPGFLEFARGSVRFEGFILSPEVEQINRRFIDGELTGDQHIEAIKAAVLHG